MESISSTRMDSEEYRKGSYTDYLLQDREAWVYGPHPAGQIFGDLSPEDMVIITAKRSASIAGRADDFDRDAAARVRALHEAAWRENAERDTLQGS